MAEQRKTKPLSPPPSIRDIFRLGDLASLNDVVNSVRKFRTEKLGIPSKATPPRIPNQRTESGRFIKKNHLKMVREEAFELLDAIQDDNLVDIGDAVGDLLVVLAGVCCDYGLPLAALFSETQVANMRKEHDPTCADGGKPVRKPKGWTPPRIKEVLEYHGGIKIK